MADYWAYHDLFKGARYWNSMPVNDDRPIDLSSAMLAERDLREYNFCHVNLTAANFRDADLRGADFSGADLQYAEFEGTNVAGALFSACRFGFTRFTTIDLSDAIGLADTKHTYPSSLDLFTLRRSRGHINIEFLRKCGCSDIEIAFAALYDPTLTAEQITTIVYEVDRLRGASPIQLHPVFISYSRRNALFVDALERELTTASIRVWRDIHDLAAGRIDKQIDRAMSLKPIVVLVLSYESVNSDWVQWEATRARDLEKQLGRDVLCPIALDDSWLSCDWPGPLRAQIASRNVLDFSAWTNERHLRMQFGRLLKGLREHFGVT